MHRLLLLYFFAFIVLVTAAKAQLPATPEGRRQDMSMMAYNVGFGALTSGVGAVINKPKGTKWHRQFVKGLWQGAIGGSLQYAGKKINYQINHRKNVAYGWPAKLVHAAGSSIVQSSALNQPFLRNWNIDFGPVRFDFAVGSEPSFRARFLPGFLYAMVAPFYGKFDVKTTLLTGNFAFRSDTFPKINGYEAGGISFARSFVYTDDAYKYETIAHELIHIYQYREYVVFNAWAEPWAAKVKQKKAGKFMNKWIYWDAPYFLLFYAAQGIRPPSLDKQICYYCNFYEREAEFFATNSYVPKQ